jgi:hypothetical protein
MWLQIPEISLNAVTFNFNKGDYCVIIREDDRNERMFRFPITGDETVLDAIARVDGLPAVCFKKKIWLVRPAPTKKDRCEILPVNWMDFVLYGSPATNYTLRPGDQIHIGPGQREPYKPIRIHGQLILLQSGTVTSTTPPQ